MAHLTPKAVLLTLVSIGRIKDSASCIFAEVNTGISKHEDAITPVVIDRIRRDIGVGDACDNNPIISIAAYRIAYNASVRSACNGDSILAIILNQVRLGLRVFG